MTLNNKDSENASPDSVISDCLWTLSIFNLNFFKIIDGLEAKKKSYHYLYTNWLTL